MEGLTFSDLQDVIPVSLLSRSDPGSGPRNISPIFPISAISVVV